jgi:hypothetical protein
MFEVLLGRLAQALEGRSIPYMVIGGQAVLLYAEPRLTRDIDVTLGLPVARLATLMEMVGDLQLAVRVQDPEDFVRQTMVLPCEDAASSIRVDFIFSSSPYEAQALARVNRVEVGGSEVRYASVEDIVIHK